MRGFIDILSEFLLQSLNRVWSSSLTLARSSTNCLICVRDNYTRYCLPQFYFVAMFCVFISIISTQAHAQNSGDSDDSGYCGPCQKRITDGSGAGVGCEQKRSGKYVDGYNCCEDDQIINCCDGVADGSTSLKGDECCGGMALPSDEYCCGGHAAHISKVCCQSTILKQGELCCENDIARKNEICCGSTGLATTPDKCCGDDIIDDPKLCCNGVPMEAGQYCCGTEIVDSAGDCCGGLVMSGDDECCGDENEGKIWDGDESKQCCCGDELKDKDGKDLDCDKFCDGGIVCDTEDPSIQQKMDSAVMKVAPIAWQKTRNDRIDPDEPYSAREFGGLICCNDDKIKASKPHAGGKVTKKFPSNPNSLPYWTGGWHSATYDSEKRDFVSCSSIFGDDWFRLGDYHTHTTNSAHSGTNSDGEGDYHEGTYVITANKKIYVFRNGRVMFVSNF